MPIIIAVIATALGVFVVYRIQSKPVPKPEGKTEVKIFLERIKPYDDDIDRECQVNGIPLYSDYIRAIIWRESGGNPNALRWEGSKYGYSIGLMSLLLSTAKDMGYKGDLQGLFNPETNIKYGVKYFAYQLNRYGYDVKKAISAYNAGHYTLSNWKYVNDVLNYYNQIIRER